LIAACLIVVGGWASPVQAQHEVRGVVTDSAQGQPLPGVNIVVQGTQVGTTTRSDGSYTLEVPEDRTDQGTLVFSFVGYQEKQVPIEGRSVIDVTLQPAVTALKEVVVNVGYEEQAVETTTGSVSQISGEELEIEPTTNLSNALKGTIPGVFGVTSSGRPGFDDTNLLVRGVATLNNNSPLVVIDGVPARQGGLSRLNPSSIESVSVLKDATAAIYGARAANGVILVQTKEGTAGQRRISVNVEQGYSRPAFVPEMADAFTYMSMLNEIQQYRGQPPTFSQEHVQFHKENKDLSDSWEHHNTDWYGVGLKDFSSQTVASASVSGGSESIQYRVSLRGVTEGGILVNSGMDYDQYGLRSRLNGEVSEDLNLSLNLHGRLENRITPSWTRGLNAAWEMLQRGKPMDPAFWPNGKAGPAQEQGVNPVAADRTGYDDRKQYYFQSNLTADYDVPLIEGWSVEGTFAYDLRDENRKRWQEPWTLYSWDGTRNEEEEPVLTPLEVGVADPHLSRWRETEKDYLLRAQSNYETTIGYHNVGLLLGTEYQATDGNGVSAFRRFFPTEEIQLLFAGGQQQRANNGWGWQAARLNFYGRADYNYREKYIVELVARYDGSYIFPPGDRYGFFPSASVAWRLGEEEWFDNVTGGVFDRLKLRSSFGQTGNDQVAPFQYLRTFGFNGKQAYANRLDTRIAPTRVPNQDISWEVATQFDVGLQGAVLDERLSFDASYYYHFRDDILWFRNEAVPGTAGFSLPRENIGQVKSQGVEGQLNYTQDITSDISFRIGTNASWTHNEIEYFAEPLGGEPWQRATGSPMSTELYYIADGIWNTQQEIDNADAHWEGARPGDVRFTDINGDGEITASDRKRIDENFRPDLIGGLSLGASVGQFDVAMQFQGAAQVKKYVFTSAAGTFGNYFQEFAQNRWTPENKDASGPRAYQRDDAYWAANQNTYFLRDAKYLRLKSARLGYSLPTDWAPGFRQVEVYLSGRNLFTMTPINIIDPESGIHTYPPERTFTVGIQMGL
jgi:TonB-linked SusC/RagA family outer membrane protein